VLQRINIISKTFLCALSLTMLWFESSHAVVIDVGDGSGNATAPADDPGFANVGQRGVGTAIYLGNRWVMTAAHLREGNVFLGGNEFAHITAEAIQVTNPADSDAETEESDILLLRLEEDPGLPALRLPCNPIQPGSVVTMIGRGHDREPDPSYWTVELGPAEEEDADVWTSVETAAASDRTGFRTLDTQTVRWGESLVNVTNTGTESLGFGDVVAFKTLFDTGFQVDHMAQGVRGDSGGSVFQKNDDVWELVGMIYSVDLFDNQPNSTRSAIYGNQTYVADLFKYVEEIRAVADFEPSAGDINGDGGITTLDIDAMLSAINRNSDSCHFDLDRSNRVNHADLNSLLEAAGTLPGDADLDGQVGFSDFLLVSNTFGQRAGGWSGGDFNGDGETNFADFLVITDSFGTSFADTLPTGGTSIAAVPEPLSSRCWMPLLVWLGFAARRGTPKLR